jgi:hypothetical protein
MSFADAIANVTITRANVTPSRAGFGVPCIAAYHALNNDRVRTYSSLAGMASDGFRSHDPAYKAAAAMFSQTPRPRTVKVGRRASAPTQIVRLTPVSPSASEVYTLKVDGLEVTFTADSSPTVAEVCAGLQAALAALADVDAILSGGASSASSQTLSGASLNGATGYRTMATARHITLVLSSHVDWDATTATLTGKDIDGNTITESLTIPNGGAVTVTSVKRYRSVTSLVIPVQSGAGGTFTVGVSAPVTATDDTTHVTCTSPVAGEMHSFELVSTSLASTGVFNVSLEDRTTDPGIAADLAAMLAADANWYAVVIADSAGKAEATAAAAYLETVRRIALYQTADALAHSSSSVDDVAYNLKATGYTRSSVWFYPHLGLSTGQLAAAVLGRCLPLNPGKVTFAHKELSGVTVASPTETQSANLEAKNANHYTEIGDGGDTFPGKSCEGEYIDVIRDLDKSYSRMQTAALSVVRSSDKVPFDDNGIDTMGGAIRGALKADETDGIYAKGSTSVTTPAASAVSSGDKAVRNLTGVTFFARVAGAIHITEVTGTVSV